MTKKVGELLAVTFWTKVDRVEGAEKLLVEDLERGNKFHIQGKDLIDSTLSADEFSKTEKITKMKAAELLTTLWGKPTTVKYVKENGEERILRGKLLNTEPLLGRSYFSDLDIPLGEHRTRLVDHRTLIYIIVENTKYIVSK